MLNIYSMYLRIVNDKYEQNNDMAKRCRRHKLFCFHRLISLHSQGDIQFVLIIFSTLNSLKRILKM